jgi:hypothetical protein
MDDNPGLIQHVQITLGNLQLQYSETRPEFWALRLAWEAVRLAWYVVAQHEEGGKLALVEGALKDLREQLQKGAERREKSQ